MHTIEFATIRPEFGGINSYALYTSSGTLAYYIRATYFLSITEYPFRVDCAASIAMVWVISNYIYRKYTIVRLGAFSRTQSHCSRDPGFSPMYTAVCHYIRWQTIILYACTFAHRPQSMYYILCNQSIIHLYRPSPWFPVPVDNL